LVKARNDTTGLIEYSSRDATETLQYALSALMNGGKILLRQGTYTLSRSLVSNTSNGVELYGEGNLTVLRLADSVNRSLITLQSVRDWHIHDLQLDGNKTNQAPNSTKSNAIAAWNCTNILVERIYVHDCRNYGLTFSMCTGSKMLNNYVNDSGANGITIDDQGGGGGNVVQGNVVDGASDVGITAWAGKDLLIEDNQVMNIDNNDSPYGANTHIGMMAEGSTLGCTRVTYKGNIVKACAASGFSSFPGANAINTDISVESNQISNCGKCGAYFGRSTGSRAQNNIILSCSLDGISLGENANNNTIASNQVSGCRTGVSIDTPKAVNNLVASNKLAGNTVAIKDLGTGTTISDNTT